MLHLTLSLCGDYRPDTCRAQPHAHAHTHSREPIGVERPACDGTHHHHYTGARSANANRAEPFSDHGNTSRVGCYTQTEPAGGRPRRAARAGDRRRRAEFERRQPSAAEPGTEPSRAQQRGTARRLQRETTQQITTSRGRARAARTGPGTRTAPAPPPSSESLAAVAAWRGVAGRRPGVCARQDKTCLPTTLTSHATAALLHGALHRVNLHAHVLGTGRAAPVSMTPARKRKLNP